MEFYNEKLLPKGLPEIIAQFMKAGLARARAIGKGKRGADTKKRKRRTIKRPVDFTLGLEA